MNHSQSLSLVPSAGRMSPSPSLLCRCENYAITLLEQCENLEEVETFLQTKTHDGREHKDANYIMAILDSRKKFVAHERFQYVLLKKFGESEIPVSLYVVQMY